MVGKNFIIEISDFCQGLVKSKARKIKQNVERKAMVNSEGKSTTAV